MSDRYWEPGTEIMWCYGRYYHQPMRVIADGPDELVAWLPVGTPSLFGVREDGRHIRADKATLFTIPQVQVERPWQDSSVLRVALPGNWWSVWLFFSGEDGAFEGWYGNIEEPHRREGRSLITRDHVLDVWITPDRETSRKDEDELVLAVEQGRYPEREAAAITAVPDEIEAIVARWGRPFCEGWENFTPDPAWQLPQIHR